MNEVSPADKRIRTIEVVTTSRADYGIYRPVLRAISESPDLALCLLVSGPHLSPAFGLTVREVEADGFKIGERIEMLLSSDTPEGVAKSIGLGVIGFAQAYARFRPDILMVLGDRFEMYAAALAALPFKIPVAHIHGGEVTHGAIDDSLRHSITKLSHLHFVSTQAYVDRVIQLGEAPWRVTLCGAPSLDNLRDMKLLNRLEFGKRFGVALGDNFLLVTYHPVTLEYEQTQWHVTELLAALESIGLPVLFTMANADTGGATINGMLGEFVAKHEWAHLVSNLGTQGYFSAMALANAMIGNSSSGIVESASLSIPVVNIGARQQGRVRGANVIDTGYERHEILSGIHRALDPDWQAGWSGAPNPYDCGGASFRIVERLSNVSLDAQLITKEFHDLRQAPTLLPL